MFIQHLIELAGYREDNRWVDKQGVCMLHTLVLTPRRQQVNEQQTTEQRIDTTGTPVHRVFYEPLWLQDNIALLIISFSLS